MSNLWLIASASKQIVPSLSQKIKLCLLPETLQMVFSRSQAHGLLTTGLIGVDLKPIDFLDSKVDNWNRNAEI